MVRTPCCDKMGLKKGPWTAEEDHILVSYIQRYGHGNWRALPKQADLLRCGKSCRLRWTNYLRQDIKRGNFSREEEQTIITLHEMLGNRWSAIAARLPGRTDNEIKNVWHTHLKKRVKPDQTIQESKVKKRCSKSMTDLPSHGSTHQMFEDPSPGLVSPAQSYSEISSSVTTSSVVTRESNCSGIKDESMDSLEEFPEIDESFWFEALSMDNCTAMVDNSSISDPFSSSINGDDMDFWLKVFMEAGDLQGDREINLDI